MLLKIVTPSGLRTARYHLERDEVALLEEGGRHARRSVDVAALLRLLIRC